LTNQQDPHHDLSDLDFKDDIALLDKSTTTASSHLTALAEQASGVPHSTGLLGEGGDLVQMNMDKTKYMTVATTQCDFSVPSLGYLHQVDDFK